MGTTHELRVKALTNIKATPERESAVAQLRTNAINQVILTEAATAVKHPVKTASQRVLPETIQARLSDRLIPKVSSEALSHPLGRGLFYKR
jgi:hypothetical protein